MDDNTLGYLAYVQRTKHMTDDERVEALRLQKLAILKNIESEATSEDYQAIEKGFEAQEIGDSDTPKQDGNAKRQ